MSPTTHTNRSTGWLHVARAAAGRALSRLALPQAWRPDTKAHDPVPLIRVDGPRPPQWAPRDYTAFAREGFMQNAIVYRSIRMIAENAANIPFLVYDDGRELDDHPLCDLVKAPNAHQTRADFIEELIGFLLVSGNAYIEATADADETIRALYCLRPDRVAIIPGDDGWPEGYVYTLDGRTTRLVGEAATGIRRVLHIKQFHPLNDHYGMSPIEAAAQAVDLHNTASRWNKSLLDNSARPSGALVYTARDGNLTSDQFERLKRELDSGFQGAQNAGRPLLLEGGLDWKAMSLSPKDLDFLEAKHAAAREIALALGVPPQLLGIPGDATYSNYAEANRAFWRQTVIPTVNRITAALTIWLAKPLSPTLVIRPDYDDADALAPEREALWSRLQSTSFLTTNEKRSLAGFDPTDELKFNPNHDDRGRFTLRPDDSEASAEDLFDRALAEDEDAERDPNIVNASRRAGPHQPATPAQAARLSIAQGQASIARRNLEHVDPHWQSPLSIHNTVAGQIAHYQGVARAAEARLAEITRDAVPGFNSTWRYDRLQSELLERGFSLTSPARGNGLMYQNSNGDTVRIMERPNHRYRTDTEWKHNFDFYYRYKPADGPWGSHIPIPSR